MAFLLLADYLALINQVALDQITENDNTRISLMELEAISEMKSYLSQRYNVDVAFSSITPFNIATVYSLGDRVQWVVSTVFSAQSTWITSNVVGVFNSGELITANNGATGHIVGLIGANVFVATTGDWATAVSITGDVSGATADVASVATYAIGDLVVGSNNNIYQATAATLLNPVTTPADWDLMAANNTLFYNSYPYAPYNGDIVYQINTQIVFVGSIYKAVKTVVPGMQPLRADGTVNTDWWALIGTAGTTTGVLPSDTANWTAGDNRDQQTVQHCVDICLYHLHARINPRNIPELRMVRYDGNGPDQKGGAIGWLKNVAAGKLNANIPQRYEFGTVPGVSIAYGNSTNLRNQTSY